jgi:hypothetical protein
VGEVLENPTARSTTSLTATPGGIPSGGLSRGPTVGLNRGLSRELNRELSSGLNKELSQLVLVSLLIGPLVVAIGCGDSVEPTDPAASPSQSAEAAAPVTPVPAVTPVVPAQAAAAAKDAGAAQVPSGLALDAAADGTIRLTGKDRWGGQIDTAYESLEYLNNALPVLKRSLTDEQSRALDALIEGLGTSAEAGGAVESASAN